MLLSKIQRTRRSFFAIQSLLLLMSCPTTTKKSRQCSIILQQRREKGWQIPAPQLFFWAKIFIHALTVTFPQTIKVFQAVTYIMVFVVSKISGIATIKVFHVANNCGVGFCHTFCWTLKAKRQNISVCFLLWFIKSIFGISAGTKALFVVAVCYPDISFHLQ